MKQNRPKSSFKKKKGEDLQYVNFQDIDQYSDLLYEEKYEDKIKGARSILYLAKDPAKMIQIVNTKRNILDILSRTLRDEHKNSVELAQLLLAFFCSYSYYIEFHPYLLDQTIGEICLSIINFQHMKYEIRRDEIIRYSNNEKISKIEYQNSIEKFLFLVRKQDRILKMAFLILLHLAEDPKVEKKMVKKDIVNAILKHLKRPNINVLSELLLFLKKLSMFQVNKDAMIKEGILDLIMGVFQRKHLLIWDIAIQLLFNLSFDPKFRKILISRKDYFLQITEYFKTGELRLNILKLLYNLSLEEKAKPLFFESDCLFLLYELMDKFPEKIIGAELAALSLNLTTYPPNAQKISSDGRGKSLIVRALKNKDHELLKIVKNILKYSEDPETNTIYVEYINEHFIPILASKFDSPDFQTEILEILSYIKVDWGEMLKANSLIRFFEEHLQNSNANSLARKSSYANENDELLIGVLNFLCNVASYKTTSTQIAKSKIINLLYNTLKNSKNCDVHFVVISTLYQMMPWEETRAQILLKDELVQEIINFLKRPEKDIKFVSMIFLEIVQLYDKKKKEMIKRKKFKSYDIPLIKILKDIKMSLNENIGSHYDMDDEDDLARQFEDENDDDLIGYKY